ncbi:hypothetical protein Ciccas_007405, partial [Cichlidogyrus casuarinus]
MLQEHVDPLMCEELRSEYSSTVYHNRIYSWANKTIIPAAPSNMPLTGEALISTWTGALLLSAYVALCLKNYLEAWRFARFILLQTPVLDEGNLFIDEALSTPIEGAPPMLFFGSLAPPIHKFYAKLYASEAQTLLGNPDKGFNCLNILVRKNSKANSNENIDEGGQSLQLFANIFATESFS